MKPLLLAARQLSVEYCSTGMLFYPAISIRIWVGMIMSIAYAAAGIVTAFGIALILGFRPGMPGRWRKSKARRSAAAVPSYRAVSVQHGEHACDGIRKLIGKRFLAGQTPMLPLEDCSSPNCDCRYIHHEDRREVVRDRRSITDPTEPELEKRQSSGRRRTDPRQL